MDDNEIVINNLFLLANVVSLKKMATFSFASIIIYKFWLLLCNNSIFLLTDFALYTLKIKT